MNKSWLTFIILLILDRIITMFMVNRYSLTIEANPLMAAYYPYSLILAGMGALIISYYAKKIKPAIWAMITIYGIILINNLYVIYRMAV
jgi:hypothetical protein